MADLFITIGGVSQIPIDYGITTGVSIQAADKLQARGSIYNATFADRKSPIAYGYERRSAASTSVRRRCFRLQLVVAVVDLAAVVAEAGGGQGAGGAAVPSCFGSRWCW